jgi:dTDP-4-dehydrorhamnose 3,5-epimerase
LDVLELELTGVLLVSFEKHRDDRGSFMEFFSPSLLGTLGEDEILQVNLSESNQHVFRGMHLQIDPFAQGKLVTCLSGGITDFILDVRASSDTFNQHLEISLSEHDDCALFIPGRYAHGFVSESDGTLVLYAVTQPRSQAHEVSIDVKTTSVLEAIQGRELKMSTKDASAISLEEFSLKYAR